MKKNLNILVFILPIILYYTLAQFNFFRIYITDFAGIGAKLSSELLNLFSISCYYTQNLIIGTNANLQVGIGCDGLEPIIILFSAIISQKTNFTKKLIGISIGFLILKLYNVVRISTLFYVFIEKREYFDLLHINIFPFLGLLLCVVLFLSWIKIIKRWK